MITFNDLPLEIRAQIWEFTVEPRTVEVRVLDGGRPTERLVSTTPVPASLQVCHEARNMALYKQSFSELCDAQRYVWLNLDIDMVSIGKTLFRSFRAVHPSIRRLKFSRPNQEEWWYHGEAHETLDFVNAEEIHVVCEDGLGAWWGATYDHGWPCAWENVILIDADDGRTMNMVEMEKMFDNEHAALEKQYEEEYEDEIREELADMAPLEEE